MSLLNSTSNVSISSYDEEENLISLVFYIPLGIFGSFQSLINIIIFSNKKFKDKIFRYFLYHSMSEFVYLLSEILFFVSYCGQFCSDEYNYSFMVKVIQVYLDFYFTSFLAFFGIMIEITISFQRYLVVSNRTFCKIIRNPLLVTILLFIISSVLYAPILINFRIIRLYDDLAFYDYIQIVDQTLYKYYFLFISTVRGPIFTIMLTIVNLLTLVKFKKQMNKKRIIINSKGSKF
jgi:hypothetical protein